MVSMSFCLISQAVSHPRLRGDVLHAKLTGQFKRGDVVPALCQQINGQEPFDQRVRDLWKIVPALAVVCVRQDEH
jgi:hypothetical protein